MEKFEKYNPDEGTIEAWLKGFEVRLLCHNVTSEDSKRNWCRALIGEAGSSIIEGLPTALTWAQVKSELCAVLGGGEPKRRAFDALCRYKAKDKGLGEMATDIIAKASLATSDTDLQVQLGLKAFLQAVPKKIARALRRMHFDSVRDALEEAQFLQAAEEDEDKEREQVFTVETDHSPVASPQPDISKIVEACMQQLQTSTKKAGQDGRPRAPARKIKCWACNADGHTIRDCPVIAENRAAYFKQPTQPPQEN